MLRGDKPDLPTRPPVPRQAPQSDTAAGVVDDGFYGPWRIAGSCLQARRAD